MVAQRDDKDGAEQRRHKRRSGMWSAALDMAPGERVDCVVLDLSDSGAKLLVKHPAFFAAPGKMVTFHAERTGQRPARIVWAAGTRLGLEFIAGAAMPMAEAALQLDGARHKAEPREAELDPAFLRGRAKVLRELAASGATPEAAARLRTAADGLDHEADAILRRR